MRPPWTGDPQVGEVQEGEWLGLPLRSAVQDALARVDAR